MCRFSSFLAPLPCSGFLCVFCGSSQRAASETCSALLCSVLRSLCARTRFTALLMPFLVAFLLLFRLCCCLFRFCCYREFFWSWNRLLSLLHVCFLSQSKCWTLSACYKLSACFAFVIFSPRSVLLLLFFFLLWFRDFFMSSFFCFARFLLCCNLLLHLPQ